MNDKVSVYIPTYNRSELLERAVLSVLEQTYANIEVIVVDDFSTDGTPEVMARICSMDSRVSYLRNNVNRGACFNRNRAIGQATGRFITGLDDDDYFTPDRVNMFVGKWHEKEDDVIALYSDIFVKKSDAYFQLRGYPNIVHKNDLLIRNVVGNQIFTEKSVFNEAVKFDEGLASWQDLDMWLHIFCKNMGKVFKNVNSATYVLDKSHLHERISSRCIKTHVKSCNYIVAKYGFNRKFRSRLLCQAYAYSPRDIGFSKLIRASIGSQNLYLFAKMCKYRCFPERSF